MQVWVSRQKFQTVTGKSQKNRSRVAQLKSLITVPAADVKAF